MTVPCPTTSILLFTFLGTTLTFAIAEYPLDCAVIVYTPGVSATNFPSLVIVPDAGNPTDSDDLLLMKTSE